VSARCRGDTCINPDEGLNQQGEEREDESKKGESLKSVFQRAAACATLDAAGVRELAVLPVVVLCLEDEGSQPEVAVDEIKGKKVPRDRLEEGSSEGEDVESSGRSCNDFGVDDVFSLRAVLVDVRGCDTHDDNRTSPLHEAEEEEDRAKGRVASTKLEGHYVRCVILHYRCRRCMREELADVWR